MFTIRFIDQNNGTEIEICYFDKNNSGLICRFTRYINVPHSNVLALNTELQFKIVLFLSLMNQLEDFSSPFV